MKPIASLIATAALALGALVALPATANAAPPYPGTVKTTCQFQPNKTHLKAGANAYAIGTVKAGNANPKGQVIAVWHGNTGSDYRASKYKSSKYVTVGPVKPKRGTYSVTVYYQPSSSSVYKSCSDSFTQVVTRR